MGIDALRSQFADYAKDIKLNLSSVLTPTGAPGLSQSQIYGVALASAYAVKNVELVDAILADAADTLSAEHKQAAKIAAVIMAMNNVYYRFVHLVSDKAYSKLPAKLRMNGIANSGIESVDFELYSLAVSAINGCGMCIDAHVQQLEKAGVSQLAIQSSVRIAAVINASVQALTIN
jgi:alkyl hydroperoxide reductase subunit D